MLIVIPQHFEKLINDSIEFSICIENIFNSVFDGHHFVIFEIPNISNTLKELGGISIKTKAAIDKTERVSRQYSINLINMLDFFLYINSYYSQKIEISVENDKRIYTDLSFFKDRENTSKSKLICENRTDCYVYNKYFENHLVTKRLNSIARVEFDEIHGGGSTIVDEYKYHAENHKYPALCIVDTDKLEPNGVGNYYNKLSRVKKRILCQFYEIESHEIENCIPIRAIEIIKHGQLNSTIYQFIVKSLKSGFQFHTYFDYKNGILKRKIRNISSDYKESLLNFLKEEISEQDIWRCLDKPCKSTDCADCVVVPGFGPNILEMFQELLEKMSIKKRSELLNSNLNNAIQPCTLLGISYGFAAEKIRI